MISEITFEEVFPLWEKLWPGRDSIKPSTPMLDWEKTDNILYQYAAEGKEHYAPVFFGVHATHPETNRQVLIAVNSGHQTSPTRYRSRGLYVMPKFCRRGLAQALLTHTINYARERGFETVWSLPREVALKTYESVGFETKVGDIVAGWESSGVMQHERNCYAEINLK